MATQQEEQSAPLGVPALGEADEFTEILKQNFKPRTERAASEVENAIQTLVSQALADSSVIKGEVLDTIEEMIARLDEKLSAQMNEVLHAPEFQQIESAWRGLNYLVFNSETDATLKIRVLNVGKMETGLGPKCKSVRASFTPETQAYLSELDDWFVHIVDFRDALSHRIALYIPLISCLTKMMPRTGGHQ